MWHGGAWRLLLGEAKSTALQERAALAVSRVSFSLKFSGSAGFPSPLPSLLPPYLLLLLSLDFLPLPSSP